MLSLTERPELWSFSRNYIRYCFSAGNLGVQSIEVQVRLWVGTVDGNTANDKAIKSYTLTPDSTGYCDVYVEDLVDAQLQWGLPAPVAGAITPVTTQTASFFVEYREVTPLNLNPVWVSDADARRLAIKGGVPAQLFNRSLPTQLSQFTYQAGWAAFVGVTDHFYRTFVSLSPQQASSRTAELTILFSDNTTQTATIAFASLSAGIYHVPASPAAWGLAIPTGKIPVSYQVVVKTITSGATTTQVLIDGIIDHNWYREVYAFQYHNSLGGLDYQRLLGDTDEELERTVNDGERIGSAAYNLPAKHGHYFQRNISITQTFKGDAGYFASPTQQEVMKELDLSESVWMVRQLSATINQWQQVRIMNKNRKPRSASSKRWSWDVEWQWAYRIAAFSNLAYTGLGVDTNNYTTTAAVCGLVSGLATQKFTSNGFTYVQFTWAAGANSWLYHLQYREVGTAWAFTISTYTNDYLMPMDTGKTYEWRVQALCSLTDVSGWVMGQNFTT